ncbi:methylmalonyl-CoA mutase cobalamin-binding domain/chain [Rhodoligotrophos appendicifer]|uniref:cobalamin-dependent protein n=1 Tax=Rhodoligotrophos appendicifer TaxID=987056 RepID=UPI00117F6B62|nr:cobalamin-dependent protein [Rhodoligotrophos appendicifer]
MSVLDRRQVFPESVLPDAAALIDEGRSAAKHYTLQPGPFLKTYGVGSEMEYKRKRTAEGKIMTHAQIGYRDRAKSRRAYSEIWEELDKLGYRVDRYGICLDWNMGYPLAMRSKMPQGTGMIMGEVEDWIALTHSAPVAPHFGDFMIGSPAAFENTKCALLAGATSIGNLGQYFAFRQPHWDDDVATTAESLKAIALTSAQPVDIIIHSNIDDGFASMFTDLGCSLGAILLEQYIIDELCGAHASYSFGNTYARPLTRLAFQRAASSVARTPGTMIYGATTMYGPNHAANYAALASYLRMDIYGERTRPAGHAINPVPVTEAERIPDIEEIIDVHIFANRLIELDEPLHVLQTDQEIEEIVERIVEAGHRFRDTVLTGFNDAGIDTTNPFEMLLAIRRIGSKKLEELYGPGDPTEGRLRGRTPVVRSDSIEQLEAAGEGIVGKMEPGHRRAITTAGLKGCLATTDVHEYGKILVETVLRELKVDILDGGVSTDPNDLAEYALESGADFIALSSYNGIALEFVAELKADMKRIGLDIPVFVGGKLNRIPDGSNSSLPVEIGSEIAASGAIVCSTVDAMLERLTGLRGKAPVDA